MEKKTCKDCIHFKICNDYVPLIGRETKVACPDFKSTEDVVPRSEVEKLTEERDRYKKYYYRHEYDKWEAEIKQEVARELIKEFEDNIEYLHKCAELTGNIMFHWETLKAELEKKYIGEEK